MNITRIASSLIKFRSQKLNEKNIHKEKYSPKSTLALSKDEIIYKILEETFTYCKNIFQKFTLSMGCERKSWGAMSISFLMLDIFVPLSKTKDFT